ncbi:MAG: prolipoprotein diacylglyceryl transferase [Acidobacteria bacterium]|nr:prolipoprotein diacylglyceryl transferase [Acidobacteriota bacterium]
MLPKLISIGDFFLPTYGLLVTAGFLAGLWLLTRLARRDGLNADDVVNLAIYCALAGILGAKLLMFIQDFGFYRRNPGEFFSFATFQAGGIFYGGLIGALAVAWWYMRKKGLPGLRTADAFAPGLALGHAIGRVGCFAAGCCWGLECYRPWAVTFTNPDANRMFGTPLFTPLHPTQLYESAAEALIALALWRRSLAAHRPGAVLGLYLLLYSSVRFAVEFLRAHDAPNPFGGPLSASQWIALGLALLGVWILRRRPAAAQGHK